MTNSQALTAVLLTTKSVGGSAQRITVRWRNGERPAELVVNEALCTVEMIEEARVALDRIFAQRDPDRPTPDGDVAKIPVGRARRQIATFLRRHPI